MIRRIHENMSAHKKYGARSCAGVHPLPLPVPRSRSTRCGNLYLVVVEGSVAVGVDYGEQLSDFVRQVLAAGERSQQSKNAAAKMSYEQGENGGRSTKAGTQ